MEGDLQNKQSQCQDGSVHMYIYPDVIIVQWKVEPGGDCQAG